MDKESLIDDYVSLKIKLGDVKPNKREYVREIIKEAPKDFLEREIVVLVRRRNPLIPLNSQQEKRDSNPLIP